jgi:hypothetical protein
MKSEPICSSESGARHGCGRDYTRSRSDGISVPLSNTGRAALVVLALAAGVALAVAVGKATSSPAFAAPTTTEAALPEPAAELFETAYTRGGTS